MSRFSLFAIVLVVAGTAHAQSQVQLAESLNDEGKQLMLDDKPADAAAKFAQAVARIPEPKYFLNLCTARLEEGNLGAALTACNGAELNNPNDQQKAKADKLIERIKAEAKKQNLELREVGGGCSGPSCQGQGTQGTSTQGTSTQGTTQGTSDPPPPDPNQQPQTTGVRPPEYAPAIGRRLDTNLVKQERDNRYTWTLGIDFFGGGGQMGRPEAAYGSAVGGARLKVDYMLDPIQRIGSQAYLQASHFSQGRNDFTGSQTSQTLDVLDLGFALYKHFCLGSTPAACFTPLAGVALALMSPADDMDEFGSQLFNYAGVSGRAELAFTWAFGRRYEHALSVAVGGNVYSPALSGPSEGDPSGTAAERGLDRWGGAGYLSFGYTYRFNTPLGRAPFVILE